MMFAKTLCARMGTSARFKSGEGVPRSTQHGRSTLRIAGYSLISLGALILRTNYEFTSKWCLAVVYDTRVDLVQGLLHVRDTETSEVVQMLREMANFAYHPVFLPLIMVQSRSDWNSEVIWESVLNLTDLVKQTGYHNYTSDLISKGPSPDLDFTAMTQKLNFESFQTGSHKVSTENLLGLCKELDELTDDLERSVASDKSSRHRENIRAIREAAQHIRHKTEALLIKLADMQKGSTPN